MTKRNARKPRFILSLTNERGINTLAGTILLRTPKRKETKAVANVVAYVRISKEEAGSISLQTQEGQIRDWAKRNGHEVAALFQDEGVSGGVAPLKRDGAAKAIREACKRENGILVISKLDRISRDLNDVLGLVDGTLGRRATLVSVSEAFDASTASGRMFLQLLGTFGEFERNRIRERTREALKTKRREGRKTGGAQTPFGYKAKAAGVERSKNGTERQVFTLVPDKAEQKTLAEARRLRNDGLTYAKVCETLNAKGMTRREGKPWNPSKLFETLKSEDRRKADMEADK